MGINMTDEKSFRLRAPEELLERIAALGEKYGGKSSNTVMVEILSNYADLWEAAEQARLDEIERQKARVLEERSLPVRKRTGT